MKKSTAHIYLVRHGQTDWNLQGLLQGHQDIHLNETGRRQAQELHDFFKDIPLSAIYASDLARARQTAEIIAAAHGHAVNTHEALRERHFAHYEGKPYPTTEDAWLDPALETIDDMSARFGTQLLEIARGHLGENVLVVAHSGPIRGFLLHNGFADKGAIVGHPALRNGNYLLLDSDGVEFEYVRSGAFDGGGLKGAE